MKYIITESSFDRIIYNYLDSQFEPHEIVLVNIANTATRIYWVVNGFVVGEIERPTKGSFAFWISNQMFDLLKSMFSLEGPEVEHHIKKYLRIKHNINVISANSHFFENPQKWYDTYPHEKISLWNT